MRALIPSTIRPTLARNNPLDVINTVFPSQYTSSFGEQAYRKFQRQLRNQSAAATLLLGLSATIFYIALTETSKYEIGKFSIDSKNTNALIDALSGAAAICSVYAISLARNGDRSKAKNYAGIALILAAMAAICEPLRDEYDDFAHLYAHADYKTPAINYDLLSAATHSLGITTTTVAYKFPLKKAYNIYSNWQDLIGQEIRNLHTINSYISDNVVLNTTATATVIREGSERPPLAQIEITDASDNKTNSNQTIVATAVPASNSFQGKIIAYSEEINQDNQL